MLIVKSLFLFVMLRNEASKAAATLDASFLSMTNKRMKNEFCQNYVFSGCPSTGTRRRSVAWP